MLICLYHGKGEICDQNGGNINRITVSMEFLPQLRTWHGGKPVPGNVVPIIIGKELPSEQYQFIIKESSFKIDGINYVFLGETGHIYAEKINGSSLNFQQWSVDKIRVTGPTEGIISINAPPTFSYVDQQPWVCYSEVIPNSPEYGQLAPVIDFTNNFITFSENIPQVYVNGAKLTLKVTLQTFYTIP